MFVFSTYTRIMNHDGARAVARSLIERSQWFAIMPLPDDNYEVTVKAEDGPREEVRMYADDFPPNPEEPAS